MSSAALFHTLEIDNSMPAPDRAAPDRPAPDRDVSVYLDDLATRLKHSGENIHPDNSEQHWQLIERVLAYAASAEQHISEQQTRIIELEDLSTTDELTGLPNRRGLRDFLNRTLSSAKRHHETGVLAFIDMNNFKQVNDRYGHITGDKLLQHMANLLRQNLRSTDFVARVGGDEFVIILVRASERMGIERAENIQKILAREYIEKRNERIYLSASFGVTEYNGTSNFQQLMRKSDLRMYENKKRHRKLS